jgi:hypothetical protein
MTYIGRTGREAPMYKRTLKTLIVASVVGAGFAVQGAYARPIDPASVVVPKMLKAPGAHRLPKETPSWLNVSMPAYAKLVAVPGTNRFRVRSVHGGLDD